jgi:uncharacterized membrane protein SirB2
MSSGVGTTAVTSCPLPSWMNQQILNVVAWPRFFVRVLRDPRARDADGRATAFLRVHAVLVIALLLALASAVFGVILLVG